MADIELKVRVSSDGTLKLALKDVEKLGGAVKKTAGSTREAAAAQGDYNYRLNQGVTGASAAARSFSKMRDAFGSGNSGIVGSYAALAANAFAVSAAFNRLREAAQATQVLKGLEEQGARTGLTLTVTAKNMREITGDAISMAESMQSAAQMTAAGFNTSTMERLTKVATDAAAALGRNVPDAMDRIVKGTTKLEPELLDELGIMTKLDEATRLYATEIGKAPASLSRFEKQQAFVNAVAAEGERKFAGLSDSVGNLKSYDSLAAAFTDLGNNALGFLNQFLLPVANFLANNSVALAGVLVIFAGTIRSQLLPALSEMAENSAKAAKKSKELAEAKKQLVVDTANSAKVQAQEAATAARSFAIMQKAPKVFKEKAQAIKDGSIASEDFDKATKSLQRSIKTYTDNIEKGLYVEQSIVDSKKELISELQAQLAVLNKVKAADTAVANAAVANAEKVEKAKRKALKVELDAIKKQGLSEAVKKASEGDFPDAFKSLSDSVTNYKEKLSELGPGAGLKGALSGLKDSAGTVISSFSSMYQATRTAGGGLAGLRVGLVAASGGVKILGLAITNMIPIIGQILTVVGLLWEGIKWLYNKNKPEGSAALEKALEDQAERYKNVADMAANLKRIGMDTAQSQVDSLVAVSNKVNEIADGYEAIKVAESSLGKSKLTGFLAPDSNPLAGLKIDESLIGTEIYKSLETLTKAGYEPLTNSIISAISSTKELGDANVSTAKKVQILEGILKASKKSFQDIGFNSKAVADNLKGLDKAVEEFSRASVISTPFDGVAKQLTETTASVYELQASIKMGAGSAKDFGVQLSGISERSAGLLDINIQKQVREFQKAQTEIDKLQKRVDSGQASDTESRNLTQALNNQKIAAESLGKQVSSNLIKRQQEVLALQEMARLTSALVSKEAARFQMVSRGLEDSKELARAQDRSTEAQVALTVKSINAQIALQKNLRDNIKTQFEANKKAQEDKKKEIEVNKKAAEDQKKQLVSITEYQIKGAEILKQLALDKFFIEALAKAADNAEDFVKKFQELPGKFNNTLSTLSKAFKDGPLGRLFLDKTTKLSTLEINTTGVSQAEADLSNLQAAGLRLEEQLNASNSAISALEIQKFVELSKVLSNVEKSVRDSKYDLAFVLEAQEIISRIAQGANAIELQRLNLNKSILGTYGQQLKVRDTQLKNEITSIRNERQRQRLTLETNIANFNKELASGRLDKDRRKILQEQLNIAQSRLSVLNIEENTLVNQAKERSYLLTLEEASFNVFSEGLEMQQKSLDVLRKRAELQSTILSQQQESRQLDAEIGAARTGQPISERAQKSLELQAAEETFALAKEQLDLKISGIKLEYELLEAQRIASVMDFKARSQILAAEAANLAAQGKDSSQVTQMVEQLNSSINYLSTQSYKGLMNVAIDAERRGVEILGKRAEKIRAELSGIGVIRTGADTFKQAINDFKTIQKAIEGTYASMQKIPESDIAEPAVFSASEAAAKQVESNTNLISSIEKNFPPITSSIEQLEKIFKDLAATLGSKVTEAATKAKAGIVNARTGVTASNDNDADMITVQNAKMPKISIGDMQPTRVTIPNIPVELPNIANMQDQLRQISFQETMDGFSNMWNFANTAAQPLMETLKSLGPDGEAQAAVIQGVFNLGNSVQASMKQISAEGLTVQNALSAVSGAIQGIQSILNASSQARIAGVDKEIAAEQKRDGKSAESLAKIQALENKKEAMAKKQFEVNKKLALASAVVNTAAGIAGALAMLPNPAAIPMAIIAGVMGAAQIAVIASSKYGGGASKPAAVQPPSTLSIGKRSDTVDLARGPSAQAGGEAGFIRGSQGMGTNASNFRTIGSAYGGDLMRGYGNRGFVVGEKGPEILSPETPINVTPANDVMPSTPVNATINIQALDASAVQDVLLQQKGNIISMIRQAANASGQGFLEDVNVNVYTRPQVNKL